MPLMLFMLLAICFRFTEEYLLTTSSQHLCDCDRTCIPGHSKTCYYKFEVGKHFTLSRACQDCPLNLSHCFTPGCVTATGFRRIIYTVNSQFPGPLISVCENDTIVVDVVNNLGDATTSIHWHGILQRQTPYYDGVPMVTQCPINPYETFRYQFKADQPGTQFWHAHTAYQSIDGMAGMLIIRQPPTVDPNHETYDFDLNEHTILITDWHNITGDVLHGLNFRTNSPLSDHTVASLLINGRGQGVPYGDGVYTPLASFTVRKNLRYRFRLCSSVNMPCPILVSVDQHLMTIIATDGYPVEPTVVDSFRIYPGERYDFVVNANQNIGNYWIRLQGKNDFCNGLEIGSILKYEGASNFPLTNQYQNIPTNMISLTTIQPVQLNSLSKTNVEIPSLPDIQFIFSMSSYPDFKPLDIAWSKIPLTIPLISGIHLNFPSSPLLSQYHDIDESSFCNETSLTATGKNCSAEYCSCIHRIKIPLNAEAEIVLINTGDDILEHDFHLHGHNFYVVAQGLLPQDKNTIQHFKFLDSQQQIVRKYRNPVRKDTVGLLQRGYTIFRFKAVNPGFWMFHCHVAFHLEFGMGLIFQVGEPNDFLKVPHRFPYCGNYLPLMINSDYSM